MAAPRDTHNEARRTPIRALRSRLRGLGPVGAGFARYLASRRDLMTASDARELASMAERPNNVTWEAPDALIRDDLGLDPREAFGDLDREPFDTSYRFQWRRARLARGEHVILKVVRPSLVEQLESDLDRLCDMRPLLGEVCGRDIDEPIAAFRIHLERSIDLQREAQDLVRLEEECRDIAFLNVPDLIGDLSGTRCLTVLALDGPTVAETVASPEPRDGRRNERLARRLARLWLTCVLSGARFPEEPSGRNILLQPDGSIAFCGGPFHQPDWGSQDHLRAYLTAAALGDHRQLCDALLELTDRRSRRDESRLRHQLRHCSPLRDGQWDPAEDSLSRAVFAHWHRIGSLGYRPRRTLQAFFCGLSHLIEESRLLAPGENCFRGAFQEHRLRQFVHDVSDLADRRQLIATLRQQAGLLSRLPSKLDRLLSIPEATESAESKARSVRGSNHRRGPWVVVGGLLAAMSATVLLVQSLQDSQPWAEPVGALLVLGLGALVLRSACKT